MHIPFIELQHIICFELAECETNSQEGYALEDWTGTSKWSGYFFTACSMGYKPSFESGFNAVDVLKRRKLSHRKAAFDTPSSAFIFEGQNKTFTVAGLMSDGTAAPDSLLNSATWIVKVMVFNKHHINSTSVRIL